MPMELDYMTVRDWDSFDVDGAILANQIPLLRRRWDRDSETYRLNNPRRRSIALAMAGLRTLADSIELLQLRPQIVLEINGVRGRPAHLNGLGHCRINRPDPGYFQFALFVLPADPGDRDWNGPMWHLGFIRDALLPQGWLPAQADPHDQTRQLVGISPAPGDTSSVDDLCRALLPVPYDISITPL
jgi:hypothetical protein